MKNKLFSIFTALAMVLGILVSPFTSAHAAEGDTTLNVHKLAADKYNANVPMAHQGQKLTDEQIKALGTNVKPIEGVEFTIYKVTDSKTFDQYSALTTEADRTENTIPTDKDKLQELVTAGKIEKIESKITGEDGNTVWTLPQGNYWILETARPTQVTEALAIPTAISLPLVNDKGEKLSTVHIYPKNLTQKPEMDKAFGQQELGEGKEKDSKMLADWQAKYGPILNEYTRQKDLIDSIVGSSVPYEVKTELKKGQIYENLYWSDYMTAGLTYNNDLKVKVGETELTTEQYTLTERPGIGFDLTVNADTKIGEKSINELLKEGNVTITLNYSSTVNNANVVDRPDANSITFSPGKPNPKNDKTPKEVTEDDTSVEVTKTWADGDAPQGVVVTYFLIQKGDNNAEKVVATATVNTDGSLTVSSNEGIEATNNGYNVTFTKVPKGKYVVEEAADGYDPEYTTATGVTNKVNPNRITPTPVRNRTGGKKFVKHDATTGDRLSGAEFAIQQPEEKGNKYLAQANANGVAALKAAYEQAEKAYLDEVVKYNKDNSSTTTQNIEKLKQAREKAFNAYNQGNTWTWVDKLEDAYKFTSDNLGRFEVRGLADATGYRVIETKEPEGYAKVNNAVVTTFDIAEGSYKSAPDGVTYTPADESKASVSEDKGAEAIKIGNQKVTIPQTGGIGSLIFVVAGLAIMAGAYVAYRKNQARA